MNHVQEVPDHCDRIVWKGHYYHLDNVAQLRAELAKEREKVKELSTWLEDQVCETKDFAYKLENKSIALAAAQATIAEMREADLKIVGRNLTEEMALAAARLFDEANGRKITAERLWQVLFDAAPPLAIPTNLDALHEAMALECERLAGYLLHNEVRRWLNEEAAAHRARKEGK